MSDLIIQNAKQLNNNLIDIVIQAGRFKAIGPDLAALYPSMKTLDLKGLYYASAGWIDVHTHCYSASPLYFDDPDLIGITTGVTTVIDAGSVGTDDIDDFFKASCRAKTEVFAFLNVSKIGLIRQNELADLNDIAVEEINRAIQNYPHFIVGLKARMSKSVVENNDIIPLQYAQNIRKQHPQLPIMVHIGNAPPDLDDIAELLKSGDIITHCFNGKPNRILNPQGRVKNSVQAAKKRGVLLDVGHGSASFSFDIAAQAKKEGVEPDIISTDIYHKNRVNGPVFSLATVLNKFLSLDYSMAEVINKVTEAPAKALNLKNKGRIEVGLDGDVSIFSIEKNSLKLTDSDAVIKESSVQIVPIAAVVKGKCYLTEKGTLSHDINL